MKSPLVVGYKGEIGSFILGCLIKNMDKAVDISCFDINETEDERLERINKSNFIFLCVPIQETVSWLLKYKDNLKGKIVVEQCSLKEFVLNDKRLKSLNILSMYFLFRPSITHERSDRRVVMLNSQGHGDMGMMMWKGITRAGIETLFDSDVVCVEDAREHDKIMAANQALLHHLVADEFIDANYTLISRER